MAFALKGLADLNADDLTELCSAQAPESEHLDFKEDLSKKRGDDPWRSRRELAEAASNALLEHVVGFANAHGGRVVVGVRETADKPSRADSLQPLPDCHDLAERLLQVASGVITPQIPRLRARGIDLGAGGVGAVIIDIPESPLAPHRLERTRRCYVRRGTRTEELTMREIQDLTMDRRRGLERVEARLAELTRGLTIVDHARFSLRLVACPYSANIALSWDTDEAAVRPKVFNFYSSAIGPMEFANLVASFYPRRPMLRAWRWTESLTNPGITFDVFWNGSVAAVRDVVVSNDRDWYLPPGEFVAFCASFLLLIDRVRSVGGFPDAEYAIELHLELQERKLDLLKYGGSRYSIAGHVASVHPPTYSLGSASEMVAVVNQMQRDLFNSASVAAEDINLKLEDRTPAYG